MDSLTVPSDFQGTDLVPAPSQLPARKEAVSLSNVDTGDIIFPYLQLAQPSGLEQLVANTGAEGVKGGQFVNTFTGEILAPPIRAIAVHHNVTRALQPDPEKLEYKGLELCLSRDGIVGTKYGSCAVCPHKEWRNGGEKRGKPLCTESAVLTLLTQNGPIMLRVRKSTKQNKKAIQTILSDGSFNAMELWERFLLIGSERQQGKTASGAPTVYYTFTLRWERTMGVPEELQDAARRAHGFVDAAYQAGRLSTDDIDNKEPEPWGT